MATKNDVKKAVAKVVKKVGKAEKAVAKKVVKAEKAVAKKVVKKAAAVKKVVAKKTAAAKKAVAKKTAPAMKAIKKRISSPDRARRTPARAGVYFPAFLLPSLERVVLPSCCILFQGIRFSGTGVKKTPRGRLTFVITGDRGGGRCAGCVGF